jgi:hypothetical protein
VVSTPTITVHVDGKPITLFPVPVARGLTNKHDPLTCGHLHKPGDTVWTRADFNPQQLVRLCDPCAKEQAR